jgi:hypothetical protein
MNFRRTTSVFDFDNPAISWQGVSSVGRGDPWRRRGGRGGHGGGGNLDACKPTQEKIDACTQIKAKRYDKPNYNRLTAAKRAKHWKLMNSNKKPRGVDSGRGGSGGGGRNGGRGYAYLSDCKNHTPSVVSETNAKRVKQDDESDLFPMTDNESTPSNQTNKALHQRLSYVP